jgi:hypothetical protein
MISLRLFLLDRIPPRMVRQSAKQFAFRAIALHALAVAGLCLASTAVADAPPRPEFAKVAQTVGQYFESQPDQQRGDLISQKQVRAALAQVDAAGWKVPDQNKLIGRVLADNSFVVRELFTPEGRKFMRRVAQHAGTYSRLDQLSTLQNGQSTIRHLIETKQGDDFITYLATTSGGRNLGTMMAGTQGGVDLNKPTGRIYTSDELLIALKQIYDANP